MSEHTPGLTDAQADAVIDYMTGETQAFIEHYALAARQLKAELDAKLPDLAPAERAAAWVAGLPLLADPIRRDIERLQRDGPQPEAKEQSWTRRVAPPEGEPGPQK